MIEEVLNTLSINNALKFDEIPNCGIYNLEGDKILILASIKKTDELDYITNKIPNFRKKIMERMQNQKNKEEVENDKIPISKFLWDMYIIAFFKVIKGEEINITEVSKYERDRFVARKIIIQYRDLSEIKYKFDKIIFPEYELNNFSELDQNIEGEEINYDNIRDLLKKIETITKKEY